MDWQMMFGSSMQSIGWTLIIIKAILHIIFAGAIAKDAGRLNRQGRTTWLVSGATWALATLLGGVFIAAVYWFMHYSNLIRQSST